MDGIWSILPIHGPETSYLESESMFTCVFNHTDWPLCRESSSFVRCTLVMERGSAMSQAKFWNQMQCGGSSPAL